MSPRKPKRLLDVNAAAALYEQGKSDGQIGRELDFNPATITAWRARTGRPPNSPRCLPITAEQRRRIRRLLQAKLAAHTISAAIGVSVKSIHRERAAMGDDPGLLTFGSVSIASRLPIRHPSGRPLSKLRADRRPAAFQAWADGLADPEIARLLGITSQQVGEFRRSHGLPPNLAPGQSVRWRNHVPKPKAKPLGAPISPRADATFARIDAAVPRHFPEDQRADIIQDVYEALLSGEIQASEIEQAARTIGARFSRRFASAFGPRSLDEALGEDGWSLGDLIPDDRAALDMELAHMRGLAARWEMNR